MRWVSEGHLGGCLFPSEEHPNGDDATWSPEFWDHLIQSENIKTAMDVGCGFGLSTAYIRSRGVDCIGIEGSIEATRDAVTPHIIRHDFQDGPLLHAEVDLVWCAEVIEHILPEYEHHILQTLSRGRLVAMTHAVPGQAGYHHVNCQESYQIRARRLPTDSE